MSDLDKLIDAADKYADNYNGDDRENIKTDVINAFFAGSRYANEQQKKELTNRK